MKHLGWITYFLVITLQSANGQNAEADQLFLLNGDQQSVTVKKVDPETITYSFVGEDLENVIKKDEVAKIVFKSGREQVFSNTPAMTEASRSNDYKYPPMEEKMGAVLPFDFVFDDASSPEEGEQAQEYYYSELMRKPERNTINYQDLETTRRRLRDAGIGGADDLQTYDMAEIAKIVGVGVLITGKIVVKYDKTVSNSSESTTVKVDDKKNKGKAYTNEYSTSRDEFSTRVTFKIYNQDGNKLLEESRVPFLGSTRDSYVSTLSYLMKRTPFYKK